MVRAQFQTSDRANQSAFPMRARYARAESPPNRAGSDRRRWIAILTACIPLSLVLVQGGQPPGPGQVTSHATAGDSSDDRSPSSQCGDRSPSGGETLEQRQAISKPPAQAERPPYQVA